MCKWGTTTLVRVKIPTDLACTGQSYWKEKKIDLCIADIVEALQLSGIDMRGSCCGHGKYLGYIELQDGRFILLTEEFWAREIRWFLTAAMQYINLLQRFGLKPRKPKR